MTATRLAAAAFVRAYSDPAATATEQDQKARAGVYATRWAYYTNGAFEDLAAWQLYKSTHRLYRGHRSVYNPTRSLVDFYAAMVYPGVVTAFPARYPESTAIAFPLPEATAEALRRALEQLWTWSNWQTEKSVVVRWGAALGDVLCEVVDDPASGKVYPDRIHPAHVKSLTLDKAGHVKAYELEYPAVDGDGREYTYGKVVNQTEIVVLRNGQTVSRAANPYGFAPACWFRHTSEGDQWGAPALRSMSKLDELNGLVAHAHDNLHKLMAAPPIVATDGGLQRVGERVKRGASEDLSPGDAETLDLLKAGPNTSIVTVGLDTQAALAYIDKLTAEIEREHPEIVFWERLRDMSSVTGPAADRLMGDVRGYVLDAQMAYDQQMVKLFQMTIAIAGWRLAQREDGWRQPTAQQMAFAGFDLDSYKAGDLDFYLLPRPIIAPTPLERIEAERAQLLLDNEKRGGGAEGGLPAGIAARLRAGAEPSAQMRR